MACGSVGALSHGTFSIALQSWCRLVKMEPVGTTVQTAGVAPGPHAARLLSQYHAGGAWRTRTSLGAPRPRWLI